MNTTPTPQTTADRLAAAAKPDFQSAAHRAMSRAWALVADVYAGTLRLRDCAASYLPRFPAEEEEAHRARVDSSELFNAFRRTVGAMCGMVFRRDPAVKDVDADIETMLGAADAEGNALPVFAKTVFEAALRDGHSFIVTDMPRALAPTDDDGREPTLADERAAGIRPYVAHYLAAQAVNWRTSLRDGRVRLEQITFEERSTEPLAEFGEQEVVRFRVLRPGSWQVWKRAQQPTASAGGVTTYELSIESEGPFLINGRPADFIPVAVVYAGRTGHLTSSPPLLDQCLLNLKHFRMTSDLHNVMHTANIPLAWARDLADEDNPFMAVGGSILIKLRGPNGEVGYLEHQAHALKNTQEEIDRIERRIAVEGLEMLREHDGTAPTTATEYAGNMMQSTSALATAARSMQDALNLTLEHFALCLGRERETAGTVELNVEWSRLVLTAEELRVLREFVESNILSTETVLELLVRAQRLPADFNIPKELKRLFGDDADKSEAERAASAAAALAEKTAPPAGEDDAEDEDDTAGDE